MTATFSGSGTTTYNVTLSPGASVSQGVDVWTSTGSPGSVTDWGTIINSLIAGGARNLVFSEHDFPCTTVPDWHGVGIKGLVIQGAAGRAWAGGQNVPTRLIWKGTGSGRGFDLRGSSGVSIRDVGMYYDSASFTGDLIDLDGTGQTNPTSAPSFERVVLGSLSPANQQARSIIRLDQTNGAYFRNFHMFGAKSLVRGLETTSANDFSNQHSFRDGIFDGFTDAAVMNPSNEWLFDNVCWEYPSAGTNACGITSDIAHTGGTSITISAESSWWDNPQATQLAIKQPSNVSWNIKVKDCTSHLLSLTTGHFKFLGSGRVTVHDTSFATTPAIDLGTTGHHLVDLKNLDYGLTGNDHTVPQVLNLSGHGQMQIRNTGDPAQSVIPQLSTIQGYERAGGADPEPALATHSGATGITFQDWTATDLAGIIRFSTAGSPASAGDQFDLTFAVPMYAAARRSGGPKKTGLNVQVWPIKLPAAPDVGAAYAAQPYASVTDLGTDITVASTGFTIGFVNAVAASKNFAVAYRVIKQ